MIARLWLVAVLATLICSITAVRAGYLDENPDEVFADVYARLGVNPPVRAARDPAVWLRLEELKREPCDQTSVNDLALTLEKLGYRREAAQGLYNFVRQCGAPTSALHRSINIFLKLSDYPMAVEVADELIRRAPTIDEAHYLRGVALEGVKDFRRAVADYADAIELFAGNRKSISSRVFLHLANAYAELGRYCEAASPIYAWVAIDPVDRDTSASRKIIADYEQRGHCVASAEAKKERYPLGSQRNVVTVNAEINGVRGRFIIDTGASYVSLKAEFADRAKIPQADASEITLSTANGPAHGRLSKADRVLLGRLEAANVPVVVQKSERELYGVGIDGLLGMSFLSRFEVQLAGGFIELRTRRPK